MKAIVLSFDRYRSFVDHMIQCYDCLWPDHPFHFRVPYQTLAPTMDSSRVEYIKSPPGIVETVFALIDDLDDEEVVYWCIDDKYPVFLNVPKIEAMYENFSNFFKGENYSGLLACRCRGMLNSINLFEYPLKDEEGNLYWERKNYEQIWIHQYLKVKVIRYLFQSFPEGIRAAKEMDDIKMRIQKPGSHRLFVTEDNHAVFGESTSRGFITKNCYLSMKEKKLALPVWVNAVTTSGITIGNESTKCSLRSKIVKVIFRFESLWKCFSSKLRQYGGRT